MMNFLKKNALPALLLTVLLDMLGLGMLIPILPTLFTSDTPYFALSGALAGSGEVLLGGLFGLGYLGQFVGSPIIGQFSDKFGRRKVLIVTIIAGAVANAFFAYGLFIHSIAIVMLSRFAYGLMAGNAAVASAAVADISTPENRSKNYGLMGAMFGLGFIVGPFVGGKLASPEVFHLFTMTTPFIVGVALGLMNALYVYIALPETNQHITPDLKIRFHEALVNIKKAISMTEVRPMLITTFLFSMGIAFYQGFGAVLLEERFNFTKSDLGNYFAYVGLWLVVAQALLVRVVASRWKSTEVLSVTFFVMALSFFFISGNTSLAGLFANAPILAFAWGLTMANSASLLSQTATPRIMGEVMGVNTSVGALASILVPLVGGLIAHNFGVNVCAAMAGIMLVVTGVYFNIFAKYTLRPHA